jgi:hypothetical protein
MLAAANPNEVVLQAEDGEAFPTALPPRLIGAIAVDKFSDAIQRINECNDKRGTDGFSVCTIVTGLLLIVIIIGVYLGHKTSSDAAWLVGCIGWVFLMLGVSNLIQGRQWRWKAVRKQVAMESERFNAPDRTPIRWRIRYEKVQSSPAQDGGYRCWQRTKWMMQLYITVPPRQQQPSQMPQPEQQSHHQSALSPQLQVPRVVPSALALQPCAAHPNPAGASAPLHNAIVVYVGAPLQFPQQPHVGASPSPPSQP